MSNIINGDLSTGFPVVKLDSTPNAVGDSYNQKIAAVGNAGGYVVTWSAWEGQGEGTIACVYVQQFDADGTTGGHELLGFTAKTTYQQGLAHPIISTVGSEGGYVVAWEGTRVTAANPNNYNIYVQQFSADGAPLNVSPVQLTDEFNITNRQPACASLGASGDYVIAWAGTWAGTNNIYQESIFVQKFNANSSIEGNNLIRIQATGNLPVVTAIGVGGEFVVAWMGQDSANDYSIFVQKFNSNGTTVGNAPVQLEGLEVTNGYDGEPKISSLGDSGEYVVTWAGLNSHGEYSVFVQKFSANGLVIGDAPIQLGPNSSGQGPEVLAVGPDGAFAVAWTGPEDESGQSVFVQTFDANGNFANAEPMRILNGSSGMVTFQMSALGPDGAFAIVWNDGGDRPILLQQFSADGSAFGGTVALVDGLSVAQGFPYGGPQIVALGDGGDYALAWNSVAPVSFELSVFVQRFEAADFTAPSITSFSPADNAAAASINSNIVLTFDEAIAVGAGNIVLKTAAGVTVATYDAGTSANITISGNTLTINPTADLGYSTGYKLEFAVGSIKDIAGNSYAGLSDYNFTTVDPAVSVSVAPDSVTEAGTANLIFTFSREGDASKALSLSIELAGTADSEDYTTLPALTSASKPAHVWTQLLGSSAQDYARSLTTGLDGAIYMVGYTGGALDGQSNKGQDDGFLSKYSVDGSKLWTQLLGTSGNEYVNSVAAGQDGSIYVTGSTTGLLDGQTNRGEFETLLTKYTGDGTKVWTRLIGAQYSDKAYGLTVGLDGSIYIAGDAQGSFDGLSRLGMQSGFLVKYSAEGVKSWVRLNGAAQGESSVAALTTGLDGSVYMSGWIKNGALEGNTYSGALNYDAFLVKYDTSGQKLWAKQVPMYSTPNTKGSLFFDALVTGLDGSIYVGAKGGAFAAGSSTQVTDYYIYKYGADGELAWSRSVGLNGNNYLNEDVNYGVALTLGADGSIYISGHTKDSLTGEANQGQNDAFVAKFNTDGTQVWSKLLGSSGDDVPLDLSTGLDGSIYLSGWTTGSFDGRTNSGGRDAFIAKLSVDGPKISFLPGASTATLTIDPTADSRVEGSETVSVAVKPGNGYSVGLAAVAVGSITEAQVDTTAPMASTFSPADEATAVAIGANVLVTFSEGIERGAGSIVLKKADGTTVATYAQSSTEVTVSGNTLTINPTADLSYKAGYSVELAAGSVHDLAGNDYSGTSSYNFTTVDAPSVSVAVSPDPVLESGATDITYTFTRSGDFSSALTVSIDIGGLATAADYIASLSLDFSIAAVKEWTHLIGNDADSVTGLAAGIDGSILAIGPKGGGDYHDSFLLKYSSDGDLTWKVRSASGQTVSTASDGSIYVGGTTDLVNVDGDANHGFDGSYDAVITKYSTDGIKLWAHLLGGDDYDIVHSVTTVSSGGVYLVGTTQSTSINGVSNNGGYGGQDIFVSKYGTNGVLEWTKLVGGTRSEVGGYLAESLDGGFYLAGATNGVLDGLANVTNGGYDGFIRKYSANGSTEWTRMVGGSDNGISAIASGVDGAVYVGGYKYGSIDGQGSTSSYGAFVTKYSGNGVEQWTRLISGGGGTQQIP